MILKIGFQTRLGIDSLSKKTGETISFSTFNQPDSINLSITKDASSGFIHWSSKDHNLIRSEIVNSFSSEAKYYWNQGNYGNYGNYGNLGNVEFIFSKIQNTWNYGNYGNEGNLTLIYVNTFSSEAKTHWNWGNYGNIGNVDFILFSKHPIHLELW